MVQDGKVSSSSPQRRAASVVQGSCSSLTRSMPTPGAYAAHPSGLIGSLIRPPGDVVVVARPRCDHRPPALGPATPPASRARRPGRRRRRVGPPAGVLVSTTTPSRRRCGGGMCHCPGGLQWVGPSHGSRERPTKPKRVPAAVTCDGAPGRKGDDLEVPVPLDAHPAVRCRWRPPTRPTILKTKLVYRFLNGVSQRGISEAIAIRFEKPPHDWATSPRPRLEACGEAAVISCWWWSAIGPTPMRFH